MGQATEGCASAQYRKRDDKRLAAGSEASQRRITV